MNVFKFHLKIIIQFGFVITFISSLSAKNIDQFNDENYISNYFSGVIYLNENNYKESYKNFDKLKGLEENHSNYSSKYLYSLVNSGRIKDAYKYSKKLEQKNLANFESDLIIGIFYLKEKQLSLAKKYFLKLKNRNSGFLLSEFISESLLNWTTFSNLDLLSSQKKLNNLDSRFENLKNIQNVFLQCFHNSSNTDLFYKKLTSDPNTDFSRYNYFYVKYLINAGETEKARQFLNFSLTLYPRNLLLNQLKIDLIDKKIKNSFNCQNQSHIVAEILYITANALSSQSFYIFSNFYINLSKYLNDDFQSFDTLLAENFYKISNYEVAKVIYTEIGKHGDAYLWYATKQNARILLKENKKEKALKLLSKAYEKILTKNIYETYDYADFLKNNEKFTASIKFYTELLDKIEPNHSLFPKVLEGRGVSYERLGKWKKAEKDLLASLEASPEQAYVINYLAYSWIEQGVKIEQSLEMLQQANKLKANDPYIIDSLGWAFYKLKKFKEAKKYLQIAVELMPADPIVNDHFGDVLWKNGKKIQARYYWNYVLKLKDAKEEQKKVIEEKLILGL